MFIAALKTDNAPRPHFLLKTAEHFAGPNLKGEEESSDISNLPESDVLLALKHGNLKRSIACEVIESTGVGILLEEGIKKSGVELQQKLR